MSSHRRSQRMIVALCGALAVIGALGTACNSGPPPRSTPDTRGILPPTPRPTPTELPPPQVLLANGGLGVVEVALNRLLDEHVTPPDEAALMTAAWEGVRKSATLVDLPPPAPIEFSGDRAADLVRFESAWRGLRPDFRGFPGTRWTAIQSMAESLNDCHTYFLGPRLVDPSAAPQQDRALSGFGMTLTGKPAVVAEIEKEPWSPAATSGLQPGDTILDIDGQSTDGKGPLDTLMILADGDRGSNAAVRVRRPGQAEPMTLTLNRTDYEPVNVQSHVLDGGVGYIRVHSWSDEQATRKLRQVLNDLSGSKTPGWIIDLRGNPGGILNVDPMSLFFADGTAIRQKLRNGSIEDDPANGAVLPKLKPIIVLVDDGSASMSEMFALALQEHHIAKLVGSKTAGCIGGTYSADNGDGSGLAVSFATMLGPVTGTALNGIGITPDEVVERTAEDLAAGRDPQLQAAIAELKPTPAH